MSFLAKPEKYGPATTFLFGYSFAWKDVMPFPNKNPILEIRVM
jgi:hypothetical protein